MQHLVEFFSMTHIINPNCSIRQKQIILGTILGGSTLVCPKKGRNCYLSMRDKNALWMKWKAQELMSFASYDPFTEEKNGTVRWHSLCYPIFTEFHDIFYKDGKRNLKLESFENIQDIGLLVWWVDAGKMEGRQVIFKTQIWGEEGTKVVLEYLGLACFDAEIYLDRKVQRIRLTREATKKFMSLILPHAPSFIHNNIY